MFYVARMFKSIVPNIVEAFDNFKDAKAYAEIMSRQKKCKYTILTTFSIASDNVGPIICGCSADEVETYREEIDKATPALASDANEE